MRKLVDPIHEVIFITDEDEKILDFLKPEFERLKSINQLGLISEEGIYSGAKHTKSEHSFGVFHIATKASKLSNLGDIDKNSLIIASLIHNIGHCPFSFSAERGILDAVYVSDNVKKQLEKILSKVKNTIRGSFCNNCHQNCDSEIINDNNYKMLHRWFTAYKILTNYKENKQISKINVIKYLLCNRDKGFKALEEFDKLDYTLRDLYYLGIARLDVNLDSILSGIKLENEISYEDEFLPEMEMIEAIDDFLFNKVYKSNETLFLETYYKKIIARALVDEKITISKLLSMDDVELKNILNENYKEEINYISNKPLNKKVVFVSGLESTYREDISILKLECDIISVISSAYTKNQIDIFLEYPYLLKALLSFEIVEGECQIKLFIFDDCNEIFHLFLLLDKIEKITNIEFEDKSIIKFIISEKGKKDIIFKNDVLNALGEKIQPHLSEIINYALKNEKIQAEEDSSLKVSAPLPEYLSRSREDKSPSHIELKGWPGFLVIPIISEEKIDEKNLTNRFIEILPYIYKNCTIEFINLIKSKIDSNTGFYREATIYLEELVNPLCCDDEIHNRWVVPNVKILNKKGQDENEIDVVSIILTEKKLILKLIGCTSNDNPIKIYDDHKKLNVIKARLENIFNDLHIEIEYSGEKPNVKYR